MHWVLWLTVLVCAAGAYVMRHEGWPAWLLSGFTVLVAVLAFCFVTLTVRDDGDALLVRFGPLPLFRHRVPYARMEGVQVARSKLVDGWGVHWVPGRGWTWNLWGFDCVEIDASGRTLRIGTDDPRGLAAFLDKRIATGDAGGQ